MSDDCLFLTVFAPDTNKELKTTLIEEYSNEDKPSGGEIYCKIRRYRKERNLCFERRWWARLSDHGRRSLRQLFRHDELTAAFDDLLEIPGLWDGMRISTLPKLMGMKCDEVGLGSCGHAGLLIRTNRKSCGISIT